MFTWLCTQWFKRTGWTIPNPFPENTPKCIVVVAPHTSNVDFFVGVAVRNILKRDIRFLAKKELFWGPFKQFFRNLGGYPVHRGKHTRIVDFVKDLFEKHREFALTITPEGTRSKVDEWKSGFYHMARAANVPIVTCAFDYSTKRVVLGQPYYLTGTLKEEIESLRTYFSQFKGRHVHNSD